jgi:hypothetical protein
MVLKTLNVLCPQHGYGTPNPPFEVIVATRVHATGRKQPQAETRDWEQTAAIIARFFAVKAEDLS